MRDFSHVLDAEFRKGYRQWREGKPLFPKGDINKPPAHAVTLVYREEGLQTSWELQLMGLPKLMPAQRSPYQSGYAKWHSRRSQPTQAPKDLVEGNVESDCVFGEGCNAVQGNAAQQPTARVRSVA